MLLVCAAYCTAQGNNPPKAATTHNDQYNYSFTVPEGWSFMTKGTLESINTKVKNRPDFSGVQFYSGLVPASSRWPNYPYVLIQIEPMPSTARTHRDVVNTIVRNTNTRNVTFRDNPVLNVKDLRVGDLIVDTRSQRMFNVLEQGDRMQIPNPENPKEFVLKDVILREIGVAFLGSKHIVILHYYDDSKVIDLRMDAFNDMVQSFRFDEGYTFKPSMVPVGPAEEAPGPLPTRSEQQSKNLWLGFFLALGLGGLCALFVWRAKIGDVQPLRKTVEGEHL